MNIYYKQKLIFIIIIVNSDFWLFYSRINIDKNFQNIENTREKKNTIEKIIEDNFFIIDSEKLDEVIPHMYGFSVSKKGILTDNYYKQVGIYDDPEPLGVYIMIRKIGSEIKINQDFHGSFGLYIYENKNNGYFALSNSFLLLQEYLVGKQNFSFNKDFADNFIFTSYFSHSLSETLIKEIIQIPSNAIIIIDTEKKKYKKMYIDYKENSIPLESKEGIKIIDKWIDKWGFILRSLKKKTDNISFHLSGGFDTRTLLTILLNSDININKILVFSAKDNDHGHDEDLKIAKNISSKYGFKVNNFNLDNNYSKWGLKDTLFCTMYSKLGFHKEFYFKDKFYSKPRFSFTGHGGEGLRGTPGVPIKKYIKILSSNHVIGNINTFYNSSVNLFKRSVALLKKEREFNNDYEISYSLYTKTLERNHFGKQALEGFISNIYCLQPLMDLEIKQIKYNINEKPSHDLISYIYFRFAPDLIDFKFQGNRKLNDESVIKAKYLNKKYMPYKIKKDYNKYFYIDIKRKPPVHLAKEEINVLQYLKELFNSYKFFKIINKIYDKNVYNWAKKSFSESKYFPLRHGYGLLAVAITIEYLELNKKYINNSINKNNFKEKHDFYNNLIKIN